MDVALACNLPVGVVAWRAPHASLTVVVKATFSLACDGVAVLSEIQDPLSSDQALPGGEAGEAARASDFAPAKSLADVYLVGHVRSPLPVLSIATGFSVDDLERRFVAVSGTPTVAMRLSARHLRASEAADSPAVRVGPQLGIVAGWPDEVGRPDFDFGRFSAAPYGQRLPFLRDGAHVRLAGGLLERGAASVTLPGQRPRAWYLAARGLDDLPEPREVPLRCDTLCIDVDRATCSLTWRGVLGVVPLASPSAFVAVSFDAPQAERGWPALRAELDRLHWGRAAEPEATHPGAGRGAVRVGGDDDEVLTAKMSLGALLPSGPAGPPGPKFAATPGPGPAASALGDMPSVLDVGEPTTRVVRRQAGSPAAPAPSQRSLGMVLGRAAPEGDEPAPVTPRLGIRLSSVQPQALGDGILSQRAASDDEESVPQEGSAPSDAEDPVTDEDSSGVPTPRREALSTASGTLRPPAAAVAPTTHDDRGALPPSSGARTEPPPSRSATRTEPPSAFAPPASVPDPRPGWPAVPVPPPSALPFQPTSGAAAHRAPPPSDLPPHEASGQTRVLKPESLGLAQPTPFASAGGQAASRIPASRPPRPGADETTGVIDRAVLSQSPPLPFHGQLPAAPPSQAGARAPSGDTGLHVVAELLAQRAVPFSPTRDPSSVAGASSPPRSALPAPVPPPTSRAPTPPPSDGELPEPWSSRGGTRLPAPSSVEETTADDPLLPLETYAAVKAAIWGGASLADVLAEQGLDEIGWRTNDRLQAAALAAEARECRSELALSLRRALLAARERLGALVPRREPSLEAYALLRAEIDDAEDPIAVLAERGIAADEWDRLRRDWTRRCLADGDLARRLRQQIAKSREELASRTSRA